MIVDLSVTVDATTLGPPAAGSPPVVLETVTRGPGHWQSSRLAALLHTGSHVDTPLHVVESGRAIEALRLDEVCGPAVVIDVHDAGEREAIGADRLRAAGNPPAEGDIVVVRTGWTDRWWGRFPDYYTRSPFLDRGGCALARFHSPQSGRGRLLRRGVRRHARLHLGGLRRASSPARQRHPDRGAGHQPSRGRGPIRAASPVRAPGRRGSRALSDLRRGARCPGSAVEDFTVASSHGGPVDRRHSPDARRPTGNG